MKQAENLARRHVGGSQCLKNADIPAWDAAFRWIGNLFLLERIDPPCVQFYKDLLVDPIWEVPPLEAVAEALSRFFFAPLGTIGENLGKFFRRLFGELPIQLWIPVTIALIYGFLAILFFQRNYELSLCRLIRFGPVIPQTVAIRRGRLRRRKRYPEITLNSS